MEITPYIWMNGKFVPWSKAMLHVLTPTLHYGGGVFEGIRFYDTPKGPAVFRLKEHLDRLYSSAKVLKMKVPYSKKELHEAIVLLLRKNKIKSGYIRPLIYFGYGSMVLIPKGMPVHVALACWGWGKYLGNRALKVKTSSYIRLHPKSVNAEAKIVGHYVNSIMAGQDAMEKGADEALLLDFKGNVAEGPAENFFIVKNGVLLTPKPGNILKGITRDTIFSLAKDLGYPVKEVILKLRDVYAADEAFFTGTAAEISPIASIDGYKLGKHGKAGPVTKALFQAFMEVIQGRNSRYEHYLTYVR